MRSKKINNLSIQDHQKLVDHLEILKTYKKKDQVVYLKKLAKESTKLAKELECLLPEMKRLTDFLEGGPNIGSVLPLKSIGEFELVRELGQGGFATVYLARHIPLDRLVALKVSTRGAQEGRTLARLEHENIVKVFDEQTDPKTNLHWTSMQYIAGISLDTLLANISPQMRSGKDLLGIIEGFIGDNVSTDLTGFSNRERLAKYTLEEALLWMAIQLVDALELAHSKDVLHLDLKPSNILINHCGHPYLSDFNISIDPSKLRSKTFNDFGGTKGYMPPEQKKVFESTNKLSLIKELDSRADIFSLGKVFEELLGKMGNPKTDRILKRATDPDREVRFKSAKEFQEALQATFTMLQINKTLGKSKAAKRWGDRHPIVTLTLVGTLPQLAASIIGTLYNKFNVITHLSLSQKQIFEEMNLLVTPLFFLCGGIFWTIVSVQVYFKMRSVDYWNREAVTKLRKRALYLPFWGAWINTVSWLGCYGVFVKALAFDRGPLEPKLLFHLTASFLVSWLVSFSYTLLFQLYISFRDLCPCFLEISPNRWSLSASEIRNYMLILRICIAMVILIPNLATILLVMTLTSSIPADLLQSIRLLSISLVSSGILGLIIAILISERLAKAIAAYSSERPVIS